MNRRTFLLTPALAPVALAACRPQPEVAAAPAPAAAERRADIVIVGAGLGGLAAALAALRRGASVLLTEPTDWVGGQLTSQAVPPDENRWIESGGATRSYRRLREAIRDAYRNDAARPLTAAARAKKELNPGNGWVSRLCHEPSVAHRALVETLRPHIEAGRLTLLLNWSPESCDLGTDRVRAVTGVDALTGDRSTLVGDFFLDASEQGDLLPLARCEFVTGRESRAMTGEPRALAGDAEPANVQSFTVCIALEHRDGEDHTIARPAEYAFWRDFAPKLTPPYNGKLLSWDHPSAKGKRFGFSPVRYATPEGPNLWTYRRILDRVQFAPGKVPGDISIINWHHNDYLLGPLHAVSPEDAAKHLARARELSRCLIYWLQKDAPRPDGKAGWPGLRPCGEAVGTADGLAKAPYIRESRRIKAELTIVEQHVLRNLRKGQAKGGPVTAERYPDSVGIGHYAMDLHPSTGGDNGIGGDALPFQIPLGSLLPVRLENLLPACKNIGTTHLTNGCYRLHPVEWNIGEAAGALAAYCLREKCAPRQVRKDAMRLDSFQTELRDQGFELEWPAKAAEGA